MNTILAPIILFVYNRPEHTRKTLEALSRNTLANESVLYIYCDGIPENASDELKGKNDFVKEIIREKQWCKEVHIIEADINKGLANSVINGVTDVVNQYGKIIVLEDDLITSTYFLEYMNTALDIYALNSKVIQVSGFGFSSPKIKQAKSSFFLPLTSTWGWATWKRVWDSVDFECSDYVLLKKDKKLTYRFNYNGSYNYKKMFLQQMESDKISSWGIRFYWNAFKKNGVVLFPDRSLVVNNGWDSSGKHQDSYNIFPISNWDENYKIDNFPESITINTEINKIISKYLKKRTSLVTKIFYRLKLIIMKN